MWYNKTVPEREGHTLTGGSQQLERVDTMTTKMTKKDYFNALLTYVPADRADLTAFIARELEALSKKNTNTKAAQESAAKNADVSAKLLEIMVGRPEHTVSELTYFVGDPDVSTQRVAIVLASLVSAGKVERVEKGRKAYFKLVG